MKIQSLVLVFGLFLSGLFPTTVVALEKPKVESFTASKLEVDVTDPDLTIDFEVVISHPKGIENNSTLLVFTNSSSITLSVPLVRTDSPIDFASPKVTFRGKISLPRTLKPGVYTYSIDGVRNNVDSGTRFPTGIVTGPIVRNLKGAESGILVRSNGYLNLDYETINGPAFGSQSGISYLNPGKYLSAIAPIWKVGEIFNPEDYFELSVPNAELSISSFTPKICFVNGKKLNLIAEGECHYVVSTAKTRDYIEKSKVLSSIISEARMTQVLNVENVTPFKPSSLPTSILLPPVYASGTAAVDHVLPKTISPNICETAGYVVRIIKTGTCKLSYRAEGSAKYLPSDTYLQNIEILDVNLSVPVPTETLSPDSSASTVVKKTIACIKAKKSKVKLVTNSRCPKGYSRVR